MSVVFDVEMPIRAPRLCDNLDRKYILLNAIHILRTMNS